MHFAKSWIRRLCCVAFVVLAGLTGYVCAEGDEEADSICDHKWENVFHIESIEECIEQGDEEVHWLARYYPTMTCIYCGDYGTHIGGSKSGQPHAYELLEWYGGEESAIMLLQCHICGFQKQMEFEYDMILNAPKPPCLTGEPCTRRNRGEMNAQGKIVPWVKSDEERVSMSALFYYEEAQTYRPVGRHYCYLCGRPGYEETVRPAPVIKESWIGLTIMTEEEFFSVDMPNNLPYQLIDQLREEAQAS